MIVFSLLSEGRLKVEFGLCHAGGTFKIHSKCVCVCVSVCMCEFITTINHCTRHKEFNYRQKGTFENRERSSFVEKQLPPVDNWTNVMWAGAPQKPKWSYVGNHPAQSLEDSKLRWPV